MTWPDEVYLAGFAIVVVVVTAGAAVVVVVVTIGAAVVVVVAAAAVVVVVVAGLGVVTVAGFEVVAVVVAVLGADDPLAGDWLAGVWPELPAADDVGVAEAAKLAGCETEGVDVVPGASGTAEADLTTSGTPLLGSAAVAGAVGTVSSTRMVVSG